MIIVKRKFWKRPASINPSRPEKLTTEGMARRPADGYFL